MITVAHRGAMGYAPENTLASFQKAISLGADMIELDVHICKTGELVVIHDETVEDRTDGKGAIADKTLAELKELDAGDGEKIPTLKEILDLADKKIKMNIELKGENTAEPVSEIIDRYVDEHGWKYEDFMVSSFNYNELKKFKQLNQKVGVGILSKEISDGLISFAEKEDAYSVNIPIAAATSEFVESAHKHGLRVFVWTANDIKDIEKAKSLDADYICTDFPDRI